MKNKLYATISMLLALSIFTISISSAQDCANATAQFNLDVNNANAGLQIGGDLWWDGDDGRYIVPKPEPGLPEVSAIFAGAIWMGGYDQSGNLKMAGQTYGAAFGASDYWPGPLDENGLSDNENCSNFDRFWSTNDLDIQAHITDWEDNGVINDPIPTTISNWPANGNPDFSSLNGFDLPVNHQGGLAPFVDQNGNGIYEAMLGDHPFINGASEGIWWVFNDAGNIHSTTGGEALQFEIQVLAYAFSSSNSSIDNTTFYDYKFINQSQESLDSTHIGIWIDFDLGCYFDDYIGCDTIQNMGYVYNMDALDGLSSCSDCAGVNTYCEDIPMVGVKILEGVKAIENGQEVDRGMSSFIYYNNGGLNPPPPPGTTDPQTATEFYNYLTGSWRDGTCITYGGDGYSPTGDCINYAFTESPDDVNGWSMCQEDLSIGDRRVIMGSGPFNIQPGETNSMTFAVVYAADVDHPCPSLDPLTEVANDVQDFYNNSVGTSQVLANEKVDISLYPNPMVDQSALIFKELENEVTQVSVFSIDGKKVQDYSNVSGSSLTIERGDLSPGIYFYKLLTKDFKIHSGKFIVQ